MIMWVPPNPKLDRDFVLKTMVWGTPHFKKPPYGRQKKGEPLKIQHGWSRNLAV